MANGLVTQAKHRLIRALGGEVKPAAQYLTPKQRVRRWLRSQRHWHTFVRAMTYINRNDIPGAIVECGVATGQSLAGLTLAHLDVLHIWHMENKDRAFRKIHGFDSFQGIPGSENQPFWFEGMCHECYLNDHPFLKFRDLVSSEVVEKIFTSADIGPVNLHEGWFKDTMTDNLSHRIDKVALVNIDCDIYQSTAQALQFLGPHLQSGCLILFDDWFYFKGNPNQGESRAFNEFLAANPHWQAIPFERYSTFCQSFILHDKRSV